MMEARSDAVKSSVAQDPGCQARESRADAVKSSIAQDPGMSGP